MSYKPKHKTTGRSVAAVTMSKEEDPPSSAVLLDSVVSLGKESIGPLLDYGKQELYKSIFQEEAAKITILDTVHSSLSTMETVVCSPHIRTLVESYQFYGMDDDGIVVVGYGPQDSGKSVAAEYLLHGDHKFRPSRGLKVSAAGMDDFAKEFGEKYLGQATGALTALVLVDAVAASDPGMVRKTVGVSGKSLRWGSERKGFDETEATKLYGDNHVHAQTIPGTFRHTPLLVLDDFNVDSKANENFVIQLFTLAAKAKIVVFILTKDKHWATKLVKLNGGMKIVPLRGNITNDWDIWEPFDQEPVWNRMDWEVSCLQDLVRPKCKELGLEAENEIKKSMLPKSAQRLVRYRATGIGGNLMKG
jgi:hypothetical protein